MEKVYVVIVNWNGACDTKACIQSLRRLTYTNFHIVLVDNGSDAKEELEWAATEPRLTLIKLKQNVGFAGGNNVGIKYAISRGAKAIWLLNNDTEVAPDLLDKMMTALYSAADIGVVTSKIYYYNSEDIIWYGGGSVWWSRGTTLHHGQFKKQSDYDTADVVDVSFATGCSMLVRAKVFNDVGLLSEKYFLYFEDADFSVRISKNGWRIVYLPHVYLWHKVSSSTQRSRVKEYYLTRNNLYFMFTYAPKHLLPVFILFFLKRNLGCIKGLWNTEYRQSLVSFLKGVVHFVIGRTGSISTKRGLQP